MKTITTYEIYRAAWNDILAKWATEKERYERSLERGREDRIAKHRMEKYSAQMDEIHDELLRMEAEAKAEA